ncbi:MAG: LysR family transcriptional regulator [Pseudomonadota bacterium]
MQEKLPENIVALLRSFLAVAESLNINQTAKSMKISRLTLKNRLKALEKLCGFRLLEFDTYNRYKLTPRAETWVHEVRIWLQQGEDIFSLSQERAGGLLQSTPEKLDEPFYSQQHAITSLWEHDTPYLKSMLNSWFKAEAQFGNPALKRVCDNAILARLRDGEFVIMGIGKNAAMMDWLGKEWCLSAIGKPLPSTAMSTKSDKIVTYSYRQAIQSGAPWYDHVSMELPRPERGTRERAYYRRLILPCKLPDGSPMIASIVELSEDLQIDNFEVPRANQPAGES